MKLYLAGPMRGREQFNFNTFEQGKVYLEWLGHKVISPHDIDIVEKFVKVAYTWEDRAVGRTFESYRRFDSVMLTDEFSIEEALRRDFKAICDADGIAFLPGFELSSGSRMERQVNEFVGGVELYVDPWQYATFTPPKDHAQRAA